MLIKKTIILSSDTKTVGHLSIIRIGQETGAKLSLVKSLGGYLILKMGNKQEERFKVERVKEEYALSSNLESTDLVGVLLLSEEGKVLARGGNSGIVNPKLPDRKEMVEEPILEEKEEIGEPDNAVKEPINDESEEKLSDEDEEKAEENPEEDEALEVEERKEESKATNAPFTFIKGENFYRNVRGKLSEIMTANPAEEKLTKLIPDSKWVKVYYEKGEYYVVGILAEEGEVKFLAYGVPGVRNVKPPKDAEELCDFLEVEGIPGEGYWLMFQDAKSGEIVKSIE